MQYLNLNNNWKRGYIVSFLKSQFKSYQEGEDSFIFLKSGKVLTIKSYETGFSNILGISYQDKSSLRRTLYLSLNGNPKRDIRSLKKFLRSRNNGKITGSKNSNTGGLEQIVA